MAEKKDKTLQVKEPAISARFTAAVVKEFNSTISNIELSPYQRKLAQHLYIKIDETLKLLEAKRVSSNQKKSPITWENINMNKLALDAVHRVELGLDALIPNHISPIPYFNSKLKKYDLDLRVGYSGKDYYRRQMCTDPPLDIIYELVHKTDKFKPIKRTHDKPVESYAFEITEPFSRGEVVGGFAYIKYGDQTKNQLVIVTKADFDKSKKRAMTQDFWGQHEAQMQFKTLVLRATDKLAMDPKKVNASFNIVENDDVTDAGLAQTEIADNENNGDVVTLETTSEEGLSGAVAEKELADEEIIDCPKIGEPVNDKICPECNEREGCPSHENPDSEHKSGI